MFFRSFGLLLGFIAVASAVSPHEQLVALSAKGNGAIKLNAELFDLITAPKRTWSAAIQLTALDKRRRCSPCREFEPSWNAVSKAWTNVPKEAQESHFFATLDFDDAPAVFQKLNLVSAPVVYVYHPTEGPRQHAPGKAPQSKFDFSNGFEPGPLAEQLSRDTPVPIPYKEPFDWGKLFTFLGISSISIVLLRFLRPILTNRYVWAFAVTLFTSVNTTGFMFVRIRNMPYTGGAGNWIAGGYQNQFGQEVHVLAGIYILLGVSFLMLSLVVPSLSSPNRQRFQVYVWTAVVMLIYSMLLSLFRVKNRGYPFRLFL
ncbi:oligosaccharyl transferase subunit OST3/OST6 family [Flagelloscypha sp. PMI_526]|nr:oligosaccharyl transferase subunit OST3/OST6 family [Flagelloscypha sp. PMI_526]